MASSVFFKFKSQKEPQRVTFDGTGISVFELKREIISISRLGDGTDFDLRIYNEDGKEEYDDDTTIIPRSTSVTARRMPASKPGQGRAARYVSGKMPTISKNSYRTENTTSNNNVNTKSGTLPTTNGVVAMDKAQTEEERIAAMFQAGAEQWEQTKQQMAGATAIHRPGGFKGKATNVPDHPPPPAYVCYRCGEKGHWIQACPTNNDPNFDGRPRVKRTTGIPRSFLQTVEKPASLGTDGPSSDDVRQPSGVMVNAEGDFVVAVPDKASWEQYQAKAQASAAKDDVSSASGSKELQERGLECPIDKRLFIDPVKMPCCGKTYCNDCIENALVNSDLVCPACSTEGVLIDDLAPDEETIEKIKAYEAEKKRKDAEKKEAEKKASASATTVDAVAKSPKSPSAKAATANSDKTDEEDKDTAHSLKTSIENGSEELGSPRPENKKKRRAEDELENDHKPNGPQSSTDVDAQEEKPVVKPLTDQNFVEQMNAMAKAQGFDPDEVKNITSQFANAAANNNTFGFPVNNMDMNSMPNPMMMMMMMGGGVSGMNGMNGMNSMNGMNGPMNMMGMPGMPNMSGMLGIPQFNNGMMNGMDNYQQFNGMGHPDMFNMNGMNGMNGMNNGIGNGMHNGMGYVSQGWDHGNAMMPQGQFHPQQNGMASHQQFQQQYNLNNNDGDDDDAYMRKPVNPHRYQARQRKARPMDYREL